MRGEYFSKKKSPQKQYEKILYAIVLSMTVRDERVMNVYWRQGSQILHSAYDSIYHLLCIVISVVSVFVSLELSYSGSHLTKICA